MAEFSGTMEFNLKDYREIKCNESVNLSYDLYVEDTEDDVIDIGIFVDYCMAFARAIGFHEKTIYEAFGREWHYE